jgi:phosphotransferase system  glucose/maltose/N-acetylglucosamine-specific IIC component
MGERASSIFPFVIAVILPPAGLIIGLAELTEDRALGARLIAVSLIAAIVWVLLFV